jgi:tetratricopeptide (TPR) repeat protein
MKVTPPDREEAVRFLTAAVALRPESPAAHVNLGFALWALGAKGQVDAIIACFKKAIALDPKHALAHNNLADILANAADPKLRDPVQAVAEGKIAIDLDPKAGVAWTTLGEAYYRTGQWQEAIAAMDEALVLFKSGNSEIFFFLAMAHQRTGHKDEAQKWYDKGIAWMDKHAPKDPTLLRYRSEAASVLGVK